MKLSLFVVLVLILSASVQTAVSQTTTIFVDVSEGAGIVDNRVGTDKVIGQAWGDYDNDGWPDLYVTDHNGRNTLYHNLGDGTFEVSSLSSGVALWSGYSSGASFVDYDNDGWRDLYVLNWGENFLYRNINGEKFENVTALAGVGDEGNGKTAAWGDYDQDGFVDLYVANWACYPNCGRPSTGDADKLYHNNGDGTFTDVTHLLSGKITGAAFVASFTDYDNDGDLDIYLVNDEFINPIGNALWRNDGPGCDGWCFIEVSEEARADTQLMGMGLATADYDNDGDQDFYFSNAGPMTLLQNQGNGTFADVAESAGVETPTSIGWGAVFFDYDNDGWQDLYLAVSDAASREGTSNNPLFRNDQDGSFDDVSAQSGVDDAGSTLGVATADYDRDGRLDLLVGNTDTGYALYQNQNPDEHAWLALDLVGGGPVNRDAIGARVFVTTPDGNRQMQELICGSSLGAGHELSLHFGLAEYTQIETLEIVWPNGLAQTFDDVAANRRLTLSYPVDAEAEVDQQLALYGEQTSNFGVLGLTIALVAALFLLKNRENGEL
ncbi:MAG: CRTAC1 family protein [Chloroflexota bacterium]